MGDVISEVGLHIEGNSPRIVYDAGRLLIKSFRIYGKAAYSIHVGMMPEEFWRLVQERSECGRGLLPSFLSDLFDGPVMERIAQGTALDEVCVTNTIPLSEAAASCGKIRQLSVAPLFAATIQRIAKGESVMSLFSEQDNLF